MSMMTSAVSLRATGKARSPRQATLPSPGFAPSAQALAKADISRRRFMSGSNFTTTSFFGNFGRLASGASELSTSATRATSPKYKPICPLCPFLT